MQNSKIYNKIKNDGDSKLNEQKEYEVYLKNTDKEIYEKLIKQKELIKKKTEDEYLEYLKTTDSDIYNKLIKTKSDNEKKEYEEFLKHTDKEV